MFLFVKSVGGSYMGVYYYSLYARNVSTLK